MAAEGIRFFTPSLGEDTGGRVMRYETQADLERAKGYYDELGKASAMFHSWTYAKDLTLVQITGELPEEQAKQYEAALAAVQ